jgi:hypothetical protein
MHVVGDFSTTNYQKPSQNLLSSLGNFIILLDSNAELLLQQKTTPPLHINYIFSLHPKMGIA